MSRRVLVIARWNANQAKNTIYTISATLRMMHAIPHTSMILKACLGWLPCVIVCSFSATALIQIMAMRIIVQISGVNFE